MRAALCCPGKEILSRHTQFWITVGIANLNESCTLLPREGDIVQTHSVLDNCWDGLPEWELGKKILSRHTQFWITIGMAYLNKSCTLLPGEGDIVQTHSVLDNCWDGLPEWELGKEILSRHTQFWITVGMAYLSESCTLLPGEGDIVQTHPVLDNC